MLGLTGCFKCPAKVQTKNTDLKQTFLPLKIIGRLLYFIHKKYDVMVYNDDNGNFKVN